jgi:hypothetical protein
VETRISTSSVKTKNKKSNVAGNDIAVKQVDEVKVEQVEDVRLQKKEIKKVNLPSKTSDKDSTPEAKTPPRERVRS